MRGGGDGSAEARSHNGEEEAAAHVEMLAPEERERRRNEKNGRYRMRR